MSLSVKQLYEELIRPIVGAIELSVHVFAVFVSRVMTNVLVFGFDFHVSDFIKYNLIC